MAARRESLVPMGYEIRRVQPPDWAAYRDIRLRALADAPYAFASTLEKERGLGEQAWRARTARNVLFIAWDGDEPAGLVGGFAEESGGWHVVSMWVSPNARGSGVADQLIDAVAEQALASRAPALSLWVADGNDRARAFYTRAGFHGTGQRQPIRPEPPQVWEEKMTRVLTGSREAAAG